MDRLSKDERDILDRFSQGLRDAEICRELRISESTLRRALKRIEALADSETNDAARNYERALRIRAEKRLHSLEARFHALMSILPGAVLVVDGRTGTIKEVNDSACNLFGYSVREFVGRSVEDLVPEDLRRVHPAYRIGFLASLRKRELGYHPPIFGVKADGSQIEVAIALTATTADDDVMVVCTEKDAWSGVERLQKLHELQS
jgi:PAS domain S-box-containing protein